MDIARKKKIIKQAINKEFKLGAIDEESNICGSYRKWELCQYDVLISGFKVLLLSTRRLTSEKFHTFENEGNQVGLSSKL